MLWLKKFASESNYLSVCNGTILSFLMLFIFLLLMVEVAVTIVDEMQPMLPVGTVHMQFAV